MIISWGIRWSLFVPDIFLRTFHKNEVSLLPVIDLAQKISFWYPYQSSNFITPAIVLLPVF